MTKSFEVVAETITKAWMKHLGYSDDALTELVLNGGHSEYCYFEGNDWNCFDEYGESHHSNYDELNETGDLVCFVLEKLNMEWREAQDD